MKIGIVSSWNDTLALFQFLTRYDNEYLIYHDQTNFPYWEKSLQYVLKCIEEASQFLISQWAEAIILDPVYELVLQQQNKSDSFHVLPLFERYLSEYGLKYSLVWKIWVLTDAWSCPEIQKFLEEKSKSYQPTQIQLNTKKFSFPFHFRVKSASSWVANIHDLWMHNPYLIRTLKNDMRYFKDANVDTILPMHYHYFRMQRTIKNFFNFHNTRFHDLSVIEECFRDLTENWRKADNYSVSVRTNQPASFLFKDKRLVWLMQRGKLVKLNIHEL